MTGNKKLPLSRIRVLDLTMVVAGPYCTSLLADWGAEVIRLDTTQVFIPYTRGTTARPSKQYVESVKGSGYGYAGNDPGDRPWNKYSMFQNHARNKLSMTVDLRAPEGREVFDRLVQISDVLVENNVPQNVDKLGLSCDCMLRNRPDLIVLRMPPYGLNGPYRNYRAFGSHIEAVSGHLYIRGYPDTDASMRGVLPIADGPSGVGGALAVVMALRHRAKTGQGQIIELSQTEHFSTYLGEALMDYSMNRRDQRPMGNRHPTLAPHGCYPCRGKDRWVTIAVSTEVEWNALCRVMGNPDWARGSKFATNESRHKNHDELDERIAAWTHDRGHYEVMRVLQSAGVPAGAVIDEAEAFRDPQLLERGFFEKLSHADCGTHLYPGLGFKMRNTPNAIRMAPCRMGEHNGYVYKELLGATEKEYCDLEGRGHIGTEYAPSAQ